MAINWPTPGFKGRTFKLCVLTRWDFNFCVRSSPLRGRRRRMKEKKRKKERKQRENSCFVCCTRCAWQRTATRTKTHQHKCFSQTLHNYTSTHCHIPRSGELRMQKLKSHLVRTQSLNVLLLKSGVGQYIAIHATLTARKFFLAYFYPSSPFTCIFSKTSPNFFLCWPAE